MSVFVDTSVFYAQHDEDANRHESAVTAMAAMFEGTRGGVLTGDYVYDETVTLARSRFADTDDALAAGDRILGRGQFPDAVDLLFVSRESFDDAVGLMSRYTDQGLSFTDATTLALAERHDIDYVLSYDSDFDGLVDRLDPHHV